MAIPHYVIRTTEFASISAQSVRLLILVAMKYTGRNNGELVATAKYLRPLGWSSGKNTTKCVRELLEAGLLVQTRIGMRPNRAAWYALGWRPLNVAEGMEIDVNAFKTFIGTPIRNAPLVPAAGIRSAHIAPHVGNNETAAYTRRRVQSEQFLASAYTRVGKASRSLPSARAKGVTMESNEATTAFIETTTRDATGTGCAPQIVLHDAHIQAWLDHQLAGARDGSRLMATAQ